MKLNPVVRIGRSNGGKTVGLMAPVRYRKRLCKTGGAFCRDGAVEGVIDNGILPGVGDLKLKFRVKKTCVMTELRRLRKMLWEIGLRITGSENKSGNSR